ncbi:unnamed protein product, partial [Onchocerca ochengi]
MTSDNQADSDRQLESAE